MPRFQGRYPVFNTPDDIAEGETGRTGKTGPKNGFTHSNLAIHFLVVLAVVIGLGTLALGLFLGLRDDDKGNKGTASYALALIQLASQTNG